jgi:hypothetical protein
MEREVDPPQVGLVSNVLTAVLGHLCIRLELAPNLVASSNDVKMLVRSRMPGGSRPDAGEDAPLLLSQGWRAAHILPELLAILEGRRLLRVADLGAEAPFGFHEATGSAAGPR